MAQISGELYLRQWKTRQYLSISDNFRPCDVDALAQKLVRKTSWMVYKKKELRFSHIMDTGQWTALREMGLAMLAGT